MKKITATLLLTMFTTVSAFAQEAEAVINTGDTAWLLIATALVMLMTPAGLALFYGGLTQNKHVLNTIGMSYMAFCTGTPGAGTPVTGTDSALASNTTVGLE